MEGANSFITPEARVQLQKKGVLLLRDASANKCGVISSSYEIIANLLLTEEEFLAHKERYVHGRARDPGAAGRRRGQPDPERGAASRGCCCTEISDAHQRRDQRPLRPALQVLPGQARARPRSRSSAPPSSPTSRPCCGRTRASASGSDRLPPKYLSAILAAEIGSSMVYRGNPDAEFEDMLRLHMERNFTTRPARPGRAG